VRPAVEADHDSITDLISTSRWKHEHLDWADTLGLVRQQPLLTAFEGTRLVGVMGFPPDPPEVAWLRLFAVARDHSPRAVWDSMWPQAAALAAQMGIDELAALDIGGWLHPILQRSGFIRTNEVMFMEWHASTTVASAPEIEGLRRIEEEDLEGLAILDRRAFGPIWQHSRNVLSLALRQASLASVVERDGQFIAYQISTSSIYGAHLARLAVDPAWQNRGIGTELVLEVLRQFALRGLTRVTLNTQVDNERSLRLYRRLGFSETGQRFPVYELMLAGATKPSVHRAQDAIG
jgi:ribosomal-protein-alanine N-acetyltransferase